MDLNKLREEKKQLETQREQGIAQINQITGVLSYIEKLIAEEETKLQVASKESADKIKQKTKK